MDGAVAIILAAGAGDRLGRGEPKAFRDLAGRPMVALAAEAAAACPGVASLVVTVPAGLEGRAEAALATEKPFLVVAGGPSRHASVRAALAAAPTDAPAVVCHDAARPFASSGLFAAVLGALDGADGAVPVLPVPDTVKRVREGVVVGTESRDDLALAQTPQAFVGAVLRDSHDRAASAGLEFTDDAAVVEWAGYRVRAVPGEEENFKITTAEDLARAELLAEAARRG